MIKPAHSSRLWGLESVYTKEQGRKAGEDRGRALDHTAPDASKSRRDAGRTRARRSPVSSHIPNERPAPDKVLTDIADYVLDYEIKSDLAWATASAWLIDTPGCGLSV